MTTRRERNTIVETGTRGTGRAQHATVCVLENGTAKVTSLLSQATLFLLFTCLAPAVGFSALFGAATSRAIGTMEMVSSTAMCGVVYALTSAQPLTIIGSNGPVLVFVAALIQLTEKMGLPFLPLYAWTGIWTSGILSLRLVGNEEKIHIHIRHYSRRMHS